MKPQVFTEPSLNVFELPVFADANIWSMWPSDKLNELAEDIRENGFDHRYPITIANVEGVMMLLDGRNRREAARIAAFAGCGNRGSDRDAFIRLGIAGARRQPCGCGKGNDFGESGRHGSGRGFVSEVQYRCRQNT